MTPRPSQSRRAWFLRGSVFPLRKLEVLALPVPRGVPGVVGVGWGRLVWLGTHGGSLTQTSTLGFLGGEMGKHEEREPGR